MAGTVGRSIGKIKYVSNASVLQVGEIHPRKDKISAFDKILLLHLTFRS